MRHRVAYRKLGRVTEHRIAMLRNQASALLQYERIQTTVPRAKELRPFVERIISIAKRSLDAPAGSARERHGAPPRRRATSPTARSSRSCSRRSRRATSSGRAATRACCGSATAAATAPKSRRSSWSAASTTPRPAKSQGGRRREAEEEDDGRPHPRSARRAEEAGTGPGQAAGSTRRPRARQEHDTAEGRRQLESSLLSSRGAMRWRVSGSFVPSSSRGSRIRPSSSNLFKKISSRSAVRSSTRGADCRRGRGCRSVCRLQRHRESPLSQRRGNLL